MERGNVARRSARKRKTSSSYTDYDVEDDDPSSLSKRAKRFNLPFSESKEGCQKILSHLMHHKYGWPFNEPVDPVALEIPDYFEKIKNPMDFGTIQKKLLASEYNFADEFAADVRLVFSNCLTYNLVGSDIHVMGTTLSALFEKQFKQLKARESKSLKKKDEISEMQSVIAELRNEHQKLLNELTKLVNTGQPAERSNSQAKGAKQKRPRVKREKVKIKVEVETFTVKEKADLTEKIGRLSPEDLQRMVELLSNEIADTVKDGELEIDLESLSVPTLKKLDAFVNSCLLAEGKSIGPNPDDDSSSSSDSDSSSSDSSDSESESEKQAPSGGKANDAST